MLRCALKSSYCVATKQLRSRFSTWSKLQNRYDSHLSDEINNIKSHGLMRPFLFTVSIGTMSFAACSILQYELSKKKIEKDTRWTKRNRRDDKTFDFRKKLNLWWNDLHEGNKVAAAIIGLNAGVFLMWQVPSLKSSMYKWFTCSPAKRLTSPMLLSCFSHSEIWHFGCNMFVLWSFAPLIQSLLGTEQFLAFYITGGTISSLASHCFKIASRSTIPSLGASGALLAVLGACCIERPEARLSILFLPFFSFSAQTALYSIIAIDVAGLIMRWKLFDHAGHLGGTLFGAWYVTYGHAVTWDKRFPIIRWWHDLRTK